MYYPTHYPHHHNVSRLCKEKVGTLSEQSQEKTYKHVSRLCNEKEKVRTCSDNRKNLKLK